MIDSIELERQADMINEELDVLRKKVEVYETLLHKIQMHADVTMNVNKMRQLIRNICNWSYAHRCGNGEHSEEEQAEIVQRAFDKLLEIEQ